ncbi:hypothetical protein QE412_000755 [Microbacterium trichothecenolyticum]|uniref:RNA polymerase sigma-70 region 1.2 domain-containing protein n=1 Tax=Microbacterium trichothecenolyticum TaxID=69370 RepID=A0ABU0TR93_MICTR|nr:hypothetical protein [Microbacterium trichothecenolyticum]
MKNLTRCQPVEELPLFRSGLDKGLTSVRERPAAVQRTFPVERRNVADTTTKTRSRSAKDTDLENSEETVTASTTTTAKKAPAKKAPAKAKAAPAKAKTKAKKDDDLDDDEDIDDEDEVELEADDADDSDDSDDEAKPASKKSDDDSDDDDEAPKPAAEALPTGAIVISSSDEDDVPVYSAQITGATADPVKDYLKQIGKVPLLNAAERGRARHAHRGGPVRRREAVEHVAGGEDEPARSRPAVGRP